MTDASRQLWRAAAWYAEHGWRVFPCIPGRKEPAVRDWPNRATSDRNEVSRWWSAQPYNIGLACGPGSDAYVLDIDRHGVDGEATLEKVSRRLGALPETVEQRTGSGGRQLLFRYPGTRECPNTASKLGPGIDTRGAGGYVVLPPSLHPCGDIYRWNAGPHQRELAALPDAWVAKVAREIRVETTVVPLRNVADGTKYINGVLDWLGRAQEKQRNSSLYWAAKRCVTACQLGLVHRGDAEAALLNTALHVGLPRIEAEKTISSAWRET